MAPRWYESAERQLEASLDRGEISYEEFRREMRDLNAELRDAAHEAAEDAYRDYIGNF